MSHYFGTDGFRGNANTDLRAPHAYRIGRFLGWYYQSPICGRKNPAARPRVVIGKDTRRSGYLFEYSLAAGLTASGADAYILHVIPTPGVSYVTRTEEFDCGVMISASHNVFSDNGIKLMDGNGEKADDELIRLAEAYLDGNLSELGIAEQDLPLATGEAIGRVVDHAAGRNRYVGYLISLATHSYKNLRIGLDCANGSAWRIAGAVFEALGAKVYRLHTDPDGTNINRDCGSTHMESLREFVLSNHLDVGYAFDGDADRCLAIDEQGNTVTGDHILYLLATAHKEDGMLAGNTVVTTVMSNLGLYRALDEAGIGYVQAAVGDRYVYEMMQQNGYQIGGEQSGHIILRKYATTGDGILTAIMLTEELERSRAPLSGLVAPVQFYPQVTENVRVADREGVMQNPKVAELMEEIRRKLGTEGRILLRKSGTEPVIRIMVEAEREELCRLYIGEVRNCIREQGYGEGENA